MAGIIVANITVMPEGIETDLKKVEAGVRKIVNVQKCEVKEVAFGLKMLQMTINVPEAEGGLDPFIERIQKGVRGVSNIEVLNVSRAL